MLDVIRTMPTMSFPCRPIPACALRSRYSCEELVDDEYDYYSNPTFSAVNVYSKDIKLKQSHKLFFKFPSNREFLRQS
ncbi:hypothetical protein RB195_023616 [Necator americanus]|uniref:Uncharacterized protein n=1 Tax=Necator americanus TaxID=51031 RepID=A0ABR1EKT8_NECAM